MEMVRVKAKVMALEGFKGFWSAGVFFPEGLSVQSVPKARLGELEEDEKKGMRISVLAVGEDAEQADAPAPAPAAVPSEPKPGEPGSPAQPLRRR